MKTAKCYSDLGLKLKAGDVITYTSKSGFFSVMEITRVEEKSIYLNGGRNSYGTFFKLMKLNTFTLNISCEK